MTTIYRSVKPVHHHPDGSQPTAAYPASVVDFFAIEQGNRRAAYWLISLLALISLLVGFLSLLESVKPRTAGTDQLDLAAQGAPSQVDVTIGQAIQALGVQH
jgi:hypothetical protein